MGEVVGPFKVEDWLTLGMLKRSIDFMSNIDRHKYKTNIDKEKEVYDYILDGYRNSA